jgi:extracellular factor (EF) 3-hydroxypalmitic acid methyl ester biosynthesis protein
MEKETISRVALLPGQNKRGIDQYLKGPPQSEKAPYQISPSFKMLVSNLRHFLSEMKQKLDAEEARIPYGSPERRFRLGAEILDAKEKMATEYINRCIARMTEIVKDFTPQEHRPHREYFQRHLHPFLLLSPFVKRAYIKPLGIPGDYEMMNMLYGDHDQGETLFARLINRYSCGVTAARAVTGRVPYMLGKLNRTLERVLKEKGTVSIISVGCGPAKEVQELIRTNPMSNRCRVTLIDAEPEALRYCHARIDDLKKATRSRVKFCCLNRSVRRLILDPFYFLDMTERQDLIYAVGLFDYLPSHIAKSLIRKLYRSLSEGGVLIIGNLNALNDARYYMEYVAEWFVLYRTPEEMACLVERSPSSGVSVETNGEGTQLYLVIKKKIEEPIVKNSETMAVFHGTV